MSEHMRRAVEKLKRKLLDLCARVEENLRQAVQSVLEQDAALAQRIIDGDTQVDEMEVDVEEQCLQILALHQPVAIDLRFIVTALKINSDLERIGDLAVNIAERSVFLATQRPIEGLFDFETMSDRVQAMVRQSIDALVRLDCSLAHRVLLADDEVDTMNREMFVAAQSRLAKHPQEAEILIHLLSVSRHLERIADHATNIAEDVIYMVQGRIVRHQPEGAGNTPS